MLSTLKIYDEEMLLHEFIMDLDENTTAVTIDIDEKQYVIDNFK